MLEDMGVREWSKIFPLCNSHICSSQLSVLPIGIGYRVIGQFEYLPHQIYPNSLFMEQVE